MAHRVSLIALKELVKNFNLNVGVKELFGQPPAVRRCQQERLELHHIARAEVLMTSGRPLLATLLAAFAWGCSIQQYLERSDSACTKNLPS